MDDIVHWCAVLFSNSNMNLPITGFQNTSFLSTPVTEIWGRIVACLLSPIIDIPRVINNYTLSFQQWLALDISDTVSVRYLDSNNLWQNLPFSSNCQ